MGMLQGLSQMDDDKLNWDAGIVPFNMPGDFFQCHSYSGSRLQHFKRISVSSQQ